jgi:cyclopropane-fatty-acyl-phospholipid synthase
MTARYLRLRDVIWAFLGRVREILADGGIYLNQGIAHAFHWNRTSQTDFLFRNVFPDAQIPGLAETLVEMERARWEILDVDGLRLHYARTCRQWAERLRARRDEARAIVGERIYRTRLLYLACSTVAFESSSVGLYQVLLRKHGDRTGSRGPRTRKDLYTTSPDGRIQCQRSSRASSTWCSGIPC